MIARRGGPHPLNRALAGLITCGLIAACGTAPPAQTDPPPPVARIIVPGDYDGSGVGIHHTEPGGAYTFGGLTLCLDRPGRAVIEKVLPVEAYGGLAVEAFAVIPNPHERGLPGFGELDTTIDELRRTGADTFPPVLFGGDPTVVDHPCPPQAEVSAGEPRMKKLLIQFTKTGTASAGDKATAIHYRSGGEQFILTVPYYVVLCGPDDRTVDCGGG